MNKQSWKNRISMTATESDVMKEVHQFTNDLEKMGLIWRFRVVDTRRSKAGIPDDNFLIKSGKRLYFLMIEYKSPKGIGNLTEGQKKLVEFFKDTQSDYIIYMISNDADEIIEEIKRLLE